MPKAASGAYRPGNAFSSGGTASGSGQPSLWSGGSDGGAPTRSYAQPDVPKAPTEDTSYTATGGGGYTSRSGADAVPDVVPPSTLPPAPEIPKVPKPSITDVGSFSADLTSPAGFGAAFAKDQKEANDLVSGVGNALFGDGGILSGPLDAAGKAIASSPLAPVADAAGLIAKPVAEVATNILSGPINAATTVARGAADIVSGAAEHIPVETVPFVGQGLAQQAEAQFEAIPDSPEKAAVRAQIQADPLAGGHLKSAFVKQYVEQQQQVNPQLYPELQTAPGTIGDTLGQLLGVTGTFSRPFERAIAGAAKADGLNRLQAIEAVHNGAVYTGGQSGNTDAEEFVYQKWKSGEWTTDQALNFLAASGMGFSHNPALEVGGQIALDPTVWGSVGAAGLSKLGLTGVRLAAEPAGALIRPVGSAGRYNLLGRLAENETASGVVRSIGKTVYTPLQESMLGSAAKTARTIIDPFHAIGGHSALGAAQVDVTVQSSVGVMEEAYGELASRQVARDLNDYGLLAKLGDAKATYVTNKARSMLLRQHVQGLLAHDLGGLLIDKTPAEVVAELRGRAPKDWADLLKQDLVSVAKRDWTGDAVPNLAERMSTFFGEGSPAEWAQRLSGKSSDYLGQLHAATYGAATTEFLDAVGAGTNEIGVAAAQELKIPRLILLNKETLTDVGARSILKDIEGAADANEAADIIRAAQKQYPSLGYVKLEDANLDSTVSRFKRLLANQVEDGVLPAQLVDREIAKLPTALQNLYAKVGGVFDFGFRPEDDKLFGLVHDGEGKYALGFDPWVDHVAASLPAARGFQALRYNAAGMPILGEVIGRPIDYIEAGAKTIKARVSSATIMEAAKSRFVASAAEKVPGLSSVEARQMFEAVSEAAQLHKTTARGLSAVDMWEAIKPIIPDSIRINGELTERDFMNMIVKAYEGDLRFVGLTQKFTGRAKSMFAAATGSNFAGQFSENLYQRIKFWANPIFQTQERVEPWVLNGLRGSDPALGTHLTVADRQALREYTNLRETGVIRASDIDQAEFSAYSQIGDGLAAELARKDPSFWSQMRNVSGAKRVNEIRTYRQDMGASMRAIWDQALPGEWDRIVANYSAEKGYLVSDAEAASRYVAEQMLAGDVTVASVIRPGADYADFSKAISSQEWYKPNSLGEIKGLDLDFMARAMGWTTRDGKTIGSVRELRAALADPTSGITSQRIGDTLRGVGAHEDYIRRVDNALNFHWDGFWRTVKGAYGLSPRESERLQGMFTEAARVRGMTPVDYISQVFSPMIGGGKGATVMSLDSAVSILRAGKGAKPEDLATQLADIFRHHLDPSAQTTLIEKFQKDLPGQINLAMTKGAPIQSRNLQATLGAFRGAEPGTGGMALRTHAVNAEGFRRGRLVNETEMASLRTRGQAILAESDAKPRVPITANYDTAAEGLFERVVTADTADAWGGATLDPHTGQFMEFEPFVYHGTGGANVESIAKAGVNRGSFTNRLSDAEGYAAGDGALYRTKPSRLTGGSRRFGDNSQIDNPRVKARDLQVSRDGGKTWHPVVPAEAPGGPYFGAIRPGNDYAIPAAEAADPAKFRAAFDSFVADNRTDLEKADHYVGVFNNHETGLVEFDVAIRTDSVRDAEAVQTIASGQTGGAYDLYHGPSGDGVFAPINRGDWTAEHSQAFGQAILDRLDAIQGMSPKAIKASAGDPDVERAVQQFAKWSRQALANGLLKGDPQYDYLFTQVTKIPTDAATPANHMHALMVAQVAQAQRLATEDAFRLQYFAKNRTFLERSLNHPFFGVYPASYMWGKIAPEMAKFMALSPFGLKTGVGAYAAADFQRAVATQRELDPKFQATMDGLGHSSVGWFLGYMLPSLPWDVGAAAPAWMRELASQGLANQQRVDRGEAPKPIDLERLLTRVGDYINPLRPATQVERPLGEIGDILSGGTKADKAQSASAQKKDAARQTKLEKDVANAIVAVETQQSRVKTAKTKSGKASAQARLDALNFDLDQKRKALAAEYPDSPKLQVQVGGAIPTNLPPVHGNAVPQGFAMRPNEPKDVPVPSGPDEAFDAQGNDLPPPTSGFEGQNRAVSQRNARGARADANPRFINVTRPPATDHGPVQFNPGVTLDPSQVEFLRGIVGPYDPNVPNYNEVGAAGYIGYRVADTVANLTRILFGR